MGTLVRLGGTLDMVVVAEGIETEFQLRRLRDLGCDLGQGYHLARPMRAGRLDEILAGGPLTGHLGLAGLDHVHERASDPAAPSPAGDSK